MEIKLEDKAQRKPVTITFTPEEFEMLKIISGNVTGFGPMRDMMSRIHDFGVNNGYNFFTPESSVPYVSNWKMHIPRVPID